MRRGHAPVAAGDLVLQIMFINQRIKIRLPENESLAVFFQKLHQYFEIGEKNSNQLGLFERRTRNDFAFVKDRSDLQNEHLYYLYFREKPDKNLSLSGQHHNGGMGSIPHHDGAMNGGMSTTPSNSQSPARGGHSSQGLQEEEIKASKNGRVAVAWHMHGGIIPGAVMRNNGAGRHNNSLGGFQGINLASSQIEKVKRPKEEKKILICPFETCLKEFSETGNLKTHMRTHTGERPFVCGQCDQQFITKGHLQAHELTHTGEKPFVCPHPGCTKRYSRAGRLKIHQRLHTGERPFICQVEGCEKAFREKGNLLTHMRIHNGLKPFKCDFADCDMSFTTQGHLTDHKRRHSGERPYICEACGDKFMRSSTLKIHMRRHTGEKPYKCDKCDRAFSESGNLRTHLRIHEDDTSSIGKRSRKNFDSRFSSAVVTPCSSTAKRTLKVTKKTLQVINKNEIKRANPAAFDSDMRMLEEEAASPPPIKLNTMPEVQLDFINSQKHSLHTGGDQSSKMDHTLSKKRKMTNCSNEAAQIKGNTGRVSNHQDQQKEEEIKLPIFKNEHGPPGNPIINDGVYGSQYQNGNQTQRFESYSIANQTPLYQYQTVNQIAGMTGSHLGGTDRGFETPFAFAQVTPAYHQQFQQQQQQATLTGLNSVTTPMMSNYPSHQLYPFSPTGLISYQQINSSAFSPKGPHNFLAAAGAGSAGQYFLNTPTAGGESNYNLRSNTRRAHVPGVGQTSVNQGQQQQQVQFFAGLGESSATNIRKAIAMGSTSSFNQQHQAVPMQASLSQAQQQHNFNQQKFSPLGQNFSLESPDVGANNAQQQNHQLNQQNVGGFQKASEAMNGQVPQITPQQSTLAQTAQSFASLGNIGNRMAVLNDQSPTGGIYHQNQQQQHSTIQRKPIPSFATPSNATVVKSQVPQNNNMSFSTSVSFAATQNQNMGGCATNTSRQEPNSCRSRRSNAPENNDDPQSFSHLAAKIWQGNAAQVTGSEESSPLIRKPVQTPIANNEWQTSFTSLASAAAQMSKNNPNLGHPINIGQSENSAFRRSPKCGGTNTQNLSAGVVVMKTGIPVSDHNTPRVFGSTTTTASDVHNSTLKQPGSSLLHNLQNTKRQGINNQISSNSANGVYIQQSTFYQAPQGAGPLNNQISQQQMVMLQAQQNQMNQQTANLKFLAGSSQGGQVVSQQQQLQGNALYKLSSPSPHHSGNSFFEDLQSPHVSSNAALAAMHHQQQQSQFAGNNQIAQQQRILQNQQQSLQ